MDPYKMNSTSQFEKSFRLAFENAEIAPSPRVWENVALTLAAGNSGKYKKRLFFFQLVAAASLLFAASIAVFNAINKHKPETLITTTINENDKTFNNEIKESPDKEIPPAIVEKKDLLQGVDDTRIIAKLKKEDDVASIPGLTEPDAEFPIITESVAYETGLNVAYFPEITQRGLFDIGIKKPADEPQMIPFWKKIDEDNDVASNVWAKAGFATGSYNAASPVGFGLSSADAAPAMTANDGSEVNVATTDKPGFSYGVGIGVGGKIGRRWILETGLNYMYSELPANSNAVIESGDLIYPVYYETKLFGDLQNVTNYQVTNSFKFLTIPIKAGYQIIDKKIGWLVTGGFSSNILLNSTIQSESYQEFSLSGNQSPYRPLSWSVLIGTEVYVNFATYYQFSIVPQYSIGLTDITKPDSNFSIVPNSFNIGINLRYMIR